MLLKKEYPIVIAFFIFVLFYVVLLTKDATRGMEPRKSSIEIKRKLTVEMEPTPNKDGEAIKARLEEITKEINENIRVYEERNGPGHCSTCGGIRSLRAKTCVHCGAP